MASKKNKEEKDIIKIDFDDLIEKVKKVVDKYKPPVVTLIALQNKDPFKILITTILSLRTKDEVTYKAAKKLFSKAKTPKEMLELNEEEIKKLIYSVGFYKIKAKNIKKISEIILEKYDGRVPSDLDKLLEFPGVGRKTANLVLAEGYDKYAICVDTHVHRISNRLGIVKTKTPEETEFSLMKVLPKKYWKIYNTYLVAFGQTICKPISPLCSQCPLNEICQKIDVKKSR